MARSPALPGPTVRAAIYARYSSDKQSEASIEDQVESCRRYAANNGWTVVEIYSDAAVSGKSSKKRPGYLKMVADAEGGRFDIVLAEAVDRLSRRLADVATLLDRLSFRKVKLHTVSQGELSPLIAGVMGAVAQGFLDDLRHKTRRGQRGRALAGLTPGGLGYGYRMVAGEKGKREINAEQAAVVRRIFEMYASGASPLAIAATLNEEGIRGPKAKVWGDTSIRGQVNRGTGILNNRAYIGKVAWDRCSYVTDPTSDSRLARPKPESEWEITDAPELRIIDDALWQRVKARQAQVKTVIGRDENGNALNRAHRAQHLLSGLLVCGCCGGNFIVLDGYRYGCATRKSKGTCSNHHKIRRDTLEHGVLAEFKERLLQPEMIEELIRRTQENRQAKQGNADAEVAAAQRQLAGIERKIDNIIEAIGEGRKSPALLGKLDELETDKVRLEAEITALSEGAYDPVPSINVEGVMATYQVVITEHLADLLDPDKVSLESSLTAQRCRDLLRSMIERIVLTPTPEDDGLQVNMYGSFGGILSAVTDAQAIESKSPSVETEGLEMSVVAGAGFEPAAFRL